MIARALGRLRRDPLLAMLLLASFVLPTVLGLVPLDRALSSVLDLRPFARGIDAPLLDDSLFRVLGVRIPALPQALQGGVLVALVLGAPTAWLVEGALAGAALDVRDARWSCGRGLGISLLALVPRVLLGSLAFAIFRSQPHDAWSSWREAMLITVSLYVVLSAMLTVLVDFARGHAVGSERNLAACFGDATVTVWRRGRVYGSLVALELGSIGLCVAAAASTRPLGLFHGALWIAGVLALALRSLIVAVGVTASAASTRA